MGCTTLLFGFLALLTMCETQQFRPTVHTPERRGSWIRNMNPSTSMYTGPHTRLMGQHRNNRFPHDMSLNNLNPSPRLKVVTTIVIRRRNRGSRRRGGSSAANGHRGAPYSLPNFQRHQSRYGQRDAHPADQQYFAGPSQNQMFLPNHIARRNHRNQPALPEMNRMANAQLPVIDIRGSGPSGTGIENAQGRYGNVGTGLGSANNNGFGKNAAVPGGRRVINELMNRGLVNVLLSGIADILANPQNPTVSSPLTMPSTVATANIHALNNLHNNNVGQIVNGAQRATYNNVGNGQTGSNSHVSAPTLPLVLTTMEPGEDPPEI